MASNDSDIFQNLLENKTYANNASTMSSFFRILPSFIKHTAAPSTPSPNHSTIDPSKSQSDSESEFNLDAITRKFDDENERTKLVDVMKAGLKHLFSDVDKSQYTLLGIKIVLEIDHEQIQEELEDSAVETPCDQSPTYILEVEDAIGLLLDYVGFWIHSCSYVITEFVTTSADETPFFNLNGRNIEDIKRSSSGYAEMVFFVLVDGLMDEELISDSEQLKKFLKDISEKQTGIWRKVHATCSSVAEN